MDFYMRLPRNKREYSLFIAIISIISVNLIAPLITCFELGFSLTTWGLTLQVLPLIWLVVVILVLLTSKPVAFLTDKILSKNDSFAAHMIVNCLLNVVMMSIILTVVASWIGTRSVTMDPINHFFYKWPRNFSVSFFIELCIAQPFARAIIYKTHQHNDKKKAQKVA